MSEPTPIPRLRDATDADVPFLESLFLALHRDEFLPLGLPEAQLETLLKMQAKAQRAGYARSFPHAIDRIVFLREERGDTPIGRLMIAVGKMELHLVDIALLPSMQGRGIGTALLRDLCRQAETLGVPLRLQVQPGNRAFHLYARLGFQLYSGGAEQGPSLAMEWTTKPSEEEADLFRKEPGDKELDTALSRTWESQVGGRFLLEATAPDSLPELVLSSFVRQKPAPRNCFSLLFLGPMEPFLPQGLYTLRAAATPVSGDAGEGVHTLFLVPLGPHDGAMRYEAVFNS